jgi:hypothetical protein
MSSPPTRVVHKSFVAESAGGSDDFREALVKLTCGSADRLRVAVALEHATGDTVAENGIYLMAGRAVRTLLPRRRMAFGSSKTEYEVSTGDVQPAFFAAAGQSIGLSAVAPRSCAASAKIGDRVGDKTGGFTVTLSTAGLMPALAKLLPLCGMSASVIKAAPRPVP